MKQNKISGVYKITNTITGDFYIGSSKDIKLRWANHKSPSQWKRSPNVKLYQAFIKYGLNNFTFDIIEETNNLKEREQYWIEQLKPTYNDRHANGKDTDRCKETIRRCNKEWNKIHRDNELARKKDYYYTHRDEQLAKSKDYYYTHRDERLTKKKERNNRLCLYAGETLTLAALSKRFSHQGIAYPYKKAKEYLIQ